MKLRDSLAENKSIRLQAEAETWQDAVKIGVDLLVAADVVEPRYYQAILDAVEQEQFAIWAIEGIEDALPLLTNLVWDGEGQTTLMQTIQERIAQATQQDARHRYPWPLRWLGWFNSN